MCAVIVFVLLYKNKKKVPLFPLYPSVFALGIFLEALILHPLLKPGFTFFDGLMRGCISATALFSWLFFLFIDDNIFQEVS